MTDAVALRFAVVARVRRVESGCWEWQANVGLDGYGRWYGNARKYETRQAHRISYMAFVGLIPDGMQIDHLCRNRKCVNPMHLEAVTQRVNILRGEGFSARNARKTHCTKGHPFTEGNLYLVRGKFRRCRTCEIGKQRLLRVAANPNIQLPNSEKTHCSRGHKYDEKNTHFLKRGGRMCRACHSENQRAYRNTRRAAA
jgi:hypothetical protein